jgi:hypothetical protein
MRHSGSATTVIRWTKTALYDLYVIILTARQKSESFDAMIRIHLTSKPGGWWHSESIVPTIQNLCGKAMATAFGALA